MLICRNQPHHTLRIYHDPKTDTYFVIHHDLVRVDFEDEDCAYTYVCSLGPSDLGYDKLPID